MNTNKMLVVAVVTVCATQVKAQSMTYNHDDPKMKQITVQEIGSGSLTPDAYYWALHNSYRKTAAAKNKLSFRTTASISAYQQVDEAERIDSALTARVKIEALNVADRTADMAWLAEGEKLNDAMGKFKTNIDRVVFSGGTPQDRSRWMEIYNMFNTAIKGTKDCYMPNAQRKMEYLRIYADIAKQNELLVRQLVQFSNKAATENLLANNMAYRKANIQSITAAAYGRWQAASKK